MCSDCFKHETNQMFKSHNFDVKNFIRECSSEVKKPVIDMKKYNFTKESQKSLL